MLFTADQIKRALFAYMFFLAMFYFYYFYFSSTSSDKGECRESFQIL